MEAVLFDSISGAAANSSSRPVMTNRMGAPSKFGYIRTAQRPAALCAPPMSLLWIHIGHCDQLLHSHRVNRRFAVLVAAEKDVLAVGGEDGGNQARVAETVLA